MKGKSRAMVLTAPNRFAMQTFELPEIGDEDGILKMELVGVCGSDVGISQGKETFGPRPFPLIMGHEIVGRIAEMGEAAKKRHGVKEGDRVVIEYAFGCGVCEACSEGRYTTCEKHWNYGSMISCKDSPHLYGGYSEYLYIHPNAKVHYVGDDVSPELGVLICAVIGNGIRWLRQMGGVSIGDAVAILGPGQQGLAGVAVAKESGANPIFAIGLSKDRERLEMAKRFGADEVIMADEQDSLAIIQEATGGRMADVVMDVTGHYSGAELALPLTGRKGTLVLPGNYKHQKASLDLDIVMTREIRVQGVFSHDSPAVRAAIKMAKSGRYPFEDLITTRLPLSQAEQAVKMVAGEIGEQMPLKVVLDPKI
ncbi:MAG: alcohol dehydrogenase catalytic domain-containing protein [Proteobacteria bacterium]|nr:alcohol dehydrogenase catalytic domain-containing protein [Pseudomonadota bacterium]MBU1450865.1 alcohol dehydrogenase catalytic domain-containing protein [Pseudomonadota bacterium]MBU2467232.1 alcohol dehydrogenase catalytic domain-containing protein [Pseudomonadota bacterium]MBU2519102.1 alcohol dehydrogenase catalytic domain-containing protein [Pseudomonadota bacterium]